MSVFKSRTPSLPDDVQSVDEIVSDLEHHLTETRRLVGVLKQRAKEAESDDFVAQQP